MAKGFHLEKWAKTRKEHVCEVCGEIIPENSRMFYEQGLDETGYYRRYTCEACKVEGGKG